MYTESYHVNIINRYNSDNAFRSYIIRAAPTTIINERGEVFSSHQLTITTQAHRLGTSELAIMRVNYGNGLFGQANSRNRVGEIKRIRPINQKYFQLQDLREGKSNTATKGLYPKY